MMQDGNVTRRNDLPQPPSDLIKAINNKTCIVFVGAGISQSANLPGWRELVNRMKTRAIERGFLSDDTQLELESHIQKDELLLALDFLDDALGKSDVCEFIQETFMEVDPKITSVHRQITNIPFFAAVTSNYDQLLEQAYKASGKDNFRVFTHADTAALSLTRASRNFFMCYLHGLAQKCETIVLSQTDYRNLMHSNRPYHSFLEYILTSFQILFLGFSLNDPDINLLMEQIQAITNGYTPTHYALIPKSEITNLKKTNYRKKYNIEILSYAPSSDYREVGDFLQLIINSLEKQVDAVDVQAANPTVIQLGEPQKQPEEAQKQLQVLQEQPEVVQEQLEVLEKQPEEAQAEPENIGRIIGKLYPRLNPGLLLYIEEHVEGDLNLAIALVSGLVRNPSVQGMAALVQTNEVVAQIEPHIPTQYLMRRVLQALSLLNRVGVEGIVENEARLLAYFFDLDFEVFLETTENLCQLGIVSKQGRYRYITKHFLAVHFASQVWNGKQKEIYSKLILDESWASIDTHTRFLQRLADVGDTRRARPFVQALLTVLFKNIDDLDTQERSKLFYTLVDADPEASLTRLEDVFQNVSHERLLEFRNGRRNIVWSLEKLLLLRETFWIASRLLLRLAAAENESYGNNATGVWKSIFLIRIGQTAFSPIERYQLIEEALNQTQSFEIRSLGVTALSQTMSVYESGSINRGPGGYIIDSHWSMTTWKEFWDAQLFALRLLDTALNDSDDTVASQARDCLMRSARALIIGLADEVLDRLEMLHFEGDGKKILWDILQDILQYQGDKLTDKQRERILEWSRYLLKEDNYHDELLRWVVSVSFTEYRDNRKDRDKEIIDKARKLAEHGYKKPSLLRVELPWLASQSVQFPSNLYAFGQFFG
ncbi:MAG: SIR2 family protein, partial [Anaerolineae bacterium]|nr:SIR2 family protein [Anaerolineae bacterium]